MSFVPILSRRRKKKVAAGGATINFVRLHVNRDSAGNNVIDIEYDGAVPDTSEGGITIGIQSSVGNDTSWTNIDPDQYTTTTVSSVYKRLTLDTGVVTAIDKDHNLRYTHDGTQGGLATEGPLTTMTNSSTQSLMDDYKAIYLMNESSGNPADSWSTHNMTNNNSATFASGKQGNATDLESTSSQWHNVAHHADFATGNVHWLGGCRFKAESLSDYEMPFSKWTAGGGKSLQVRVRSTGAIQLRVTDGVSTKTLQSSVTADTTNWFHIWAWHDPDTDTIKIRVNDTENSAAMDASGMITSTADFTVGESDGGSYFDGLVDGVFVKRGHSAVKSTAEYQLWYASGNGNDYPHKPRLS